MKIEQVSFDHREVQNGLESYPEFQNNQFADGLQLLINQFPRVVYNSELWEVAFPEARIENLHRATNEFFQELRNRLKFNGLHSFIQPLQLMDFYCSIALPPLEFGTPLLLAERSELIQTMRDLKARRVANAVYPVYVSRIGDGPILRSHFGAKNFAVVNFLLQNPTEALSREFLLHYKLIQPDANLQNAIDPINKKFRDVGLSARLSRQGDEISIRF